MIPRALLQLFSVLLLVLSTWWMAQLHSEARAVDALVSLVENEQPGLDQIRELAGVLGDFSAMKKNWIEEHYTKIKNSRVVGTNALTFAVFGIGACGWASELSALCFRRLGYETRLVQILDSEERAIHIVMEVSLESGERVIFDPLLNHLHLDAHTRRPQSAATLAREWSSICPDGASDEICQYSFEYGIRYTNWPKFGRFQSIAQGVFESLGVESLRTLWLSSRLYISRFVWVMGLFALVALNLRGRLR